MDDNPYTSPREPLYTQAGASFLRRLATFALHQKIAVSRVLWLICTIAVFTPIGFYLPEERSAWGGNFWQLLHRFLKGECALPVGCAVLLFILASIFLIPSAAAGWAAAAMLAVLRVAISRAIHGRPPAADDESGAR